MKINFRQGFISYQQSGAQAVFLIAGTIANSVSLNVAPQPTLATIAHGSTDYLFKFDQTILNAWQLTPNVNNWLFLDLNLISGDVTYGTTIVEPITSLDEPAGAMANQMWFDLRDIVMKTFNGTQWVVTPRLVVGKVIGGSSYQIQSYPIGSSVGLSTEGSPGFLMLDAQLRPLRTSSGQLLTSDSPVRIRTTVGTSGVLSEPVTGFIPVRANHSIPAMSLVYFDGEDSISLASSDPSLVDLKVPVGIVEHALTMNQVGTITQQGEITYDKWGWSSAQIGKPLYCGFNGQLTTTRPLGLQAYRVGYIKNSKTILFYIDTETQPQIVSSPGSIISGSAPILALTNTNSSGEIVTALTMAPATLDNDGYMTIAQATALTSFDTRIATNTNDIESIKIEKSSIGHKHVIDDTIGLVTALDVLTMSLTLRIPKIDGVIGNFPSINSGGTLLDSGFTYDSFASLSHVHTLADVTDLQTELNGKANRVHMHPMSSVIDLEANLNGRAPINHIHNIANIPNLELVLNTKAHIIHNHRISDVNDLQDQLDLYAFKGHSHDISNVRNLEVALHGKATSVHTHVIADTIGLQTKLNDKSDVGHVHSAVDVIDLTQTIQTVVASAINNNAPLETQLKVRDSEISTSYTEFQPSVALAFPDFKVSQGGAGLISVKGQKLSVFQGLTRLATYPNTNVNAESKVVFGAGLQATLSGDNNEVVTIQTAPISELSLLLNGVTGQLLQSNGPASQPTWVQPSIIKSQTYSHEVIASAGLMNVDCGILIVKSKFADAPNPGVQVMNIQVFVNGVLQQEGSTKKYNVTNSRTITFNVPLAQDDEVIIYSNEWLQS